MLHSEASPCPFKFSFIFFNVIEVELVYNVVLISAVQQSEPIIYIRVSTTLLIFSHIGQYRVLNRVSCAI